MPNCESCAIDVQTFCPLMIHSPLRAHGLVPARREVGSGPGSLKSWHQISSDVRIFWR